MLRVPHSFNLPFLLVLRPKDTVNANLVFLFLPVLLFQSRHHHRIGQGRRVSEGAAVGDVAEGISFTADGV